MESELLGAVVGWQVNYWVGQWWGGKRIIGLGSGGLASELLGCAVVGWQANYWVGWWGGKRIIGWDCVCDIAAGYC